MICLPCKFFLERYEKCLQINIKIFGEENGPPMCQHIKEWYDFCLTQE